ncbi:MAG: SpaH/EbpB family LPXTG-anchored major pilin [Candidatus Faecousia sp.]|nr:SpaH/EbpB family LPXTG-anchored major pilin [Candidatus Faecousia sp.]
MKRKIQKTLAWLLMLALVVTVLPFGALAAAPEDKTIIDTTKPGSITVTKYATVNKSTGTAPTYKNQQATGTENDKLTDTDTDYKPLKGATFKLFKIADADKVVEYYNGTDTATYDVSKFQYNEAKATYGGVEVTAVNNGATTNEDGVCTFSNLDVGIYVLKEVTAPDQITTPLAETCLISIPMVNTATSSNNGNAEWMYDVYVYPKNHESTGTLELTKWDQNDLAFNNSRIATFELYKKEFQADGSLPTGDWTPVTSTSSDGTTETLLTLTTGTDGKIILANLPANLYGTQYKLVEVSAPNGFIVNQTPLYFKVTTDNKITWNANSGEKGDCNNLNTGVVGTPTEETGPKLSVTLRNEQLSLTKHVQKNGGDTWETDEQYRLDDTITYQLTIYVPRNVSELNTFIIADMPDAGINDDINSIQVSYVKDETTHTLTTESNAFTATETSADGKGKGFTLTFNGTVKGDIAGQTITVTYTAKFTDNAVIAGDGNGNTATLTYSKFIGGSDDKYAITDEARVYTYQYQITKYKDSVASGNGIGSVEFKLLDKTSPENVLNVVRLEDGVYRLALAGETTGTTDTMVTKSDGTILIKGLENGTYYLKETKTIDNYNLLSKPFEIKLDVTRTTTWSEDGAYGETGQVVKTYTSTNYNLTDAMGTGTIVNKKGFVLPQTGSMGYLLFCAVGIVLIAGGTMLIFGGRKKKIR